MLFCLWHALATLVGPRCLLEELSQYSWGPVSLAPLACCLWHSSPSSSPFLRPCIVAPFGTRGLLRALDEGRRHFSNNPRAIKQRCAIGATARPQEQSLSRLYTAPHLYTAIATIAAVSRERRLERQRAFLTLRLLWSTKAFLSRPFAMRVSRRV